jgi:hypothetical protein
VSLAFPAYVTSVETSGVAVLRNTWSGKLRDPLAAINAGLPTFRVIREAYDGLPMRVAQAVAGEQIFSRARIPLPDGWHRARTDTVASGAPLTFVPGLSIAGPVSADTVRLSFVPGSARLPADAEVPEEMVVHVELDPADVAVLDARCMRRWSAPESTFELSVVRTWIEPELDASRLVAPDGPERAKRFAGMPWIPAPSVESWLFERHERRTEVPTHGNGR